MENEKTQDTGQQRNKRKTSYQNLTEEEIKQLEGYQEPPRRHSLSRTPPTKKQPEMEDEEHLRKKARVEAAKEKIATAIIEMGGVAEESEIDDILNKSLREEEVFVTDEGDRQKMEELERTRQRLLELRKQEEERRAADKKRKELEEREQEEQRTKGEEKDAGYRGRKERKRGGRRI